MKAQKILRSVQKIRWSFEAMGSGFVEDWQGRKTGKKKASTRAG
ncbi:hypothetical protein [Serratia proteamaculans]|nr:hypothetical protein [Serratia proteamaculans]